MSNRIFSGILLSFLVLGMLTCAFNIQPVKASGTVTIRADGSIDPPTAPIYTADNITYTLTGNITADGDGIMIERDDIVVDGAGYTLQGTLASNSTGIELTGRSNVTIKNMTITGFYDGIYFDSSANNKFSENCITANNGRGIFLLCSPSNSLYQNKVTRNGEGVFIGYSSNNDLRDNVFLKNEYNLGVFAETADDSLQDIDTSNTVDGQPIYYWVNRTGGVIPANAGYVAIVNSQNIMVEGLSLSHNDQGILLAYSTNTTIKSNKLADSVYGVSVVGGATNRIIQNNMTNNTYGTGFRYSSNNSLSENTFSNNTCGVLLIYSSNDNSIIGNNFVENRVGIDLTSADHNLITQNNITANSCGIWIDTSFNNTICHNNFINNTIQTLTTGNNTWDDGYPSGGNYWSDYNGTDANHDGIGDTPYIIDANDADHYPLMTQYVAVHDVAVTNVTSSKTVVDQGFSTNINVTVANQGDYTETFNVTTYINPPSPLTIVIVINITTVSLDAGKNITISLAWNTTGMAIGNYTFNAAARPVLGETNTTDNTFSVVVKVTIPGDINGDFKVSLQDLVFLAKAYGSKAGDSNWNPNADIDGNNIVGLSDLVILAQHYGQHYP